jgi:hypothetical protein
MLKLGEERINKQHTAVLQCVGLRRRSYSWFSENPPYSPIQTFAQSLMSPAAGLQQIWGLELL